MNIPIRGGKITSGFDDPRPLSQPGLHIHGALDIAGGDRMVRSPCNGKARAYCLIRPPQGGWAENEKLEIDRIPVRDYWYDIYGGIVVINEERSGRMHVMAHFWANALQSRFGKFMITESVLEARWPPFAMTSEELQVSEGMELLNFGGAGYSTGPHLHWEVHPGPRAVDYSRRLDPARWYVR